MTLTQRSLTRRFAAGVAITAVIVSVIAVAAMDRILSQAADRNLEQRADRTLAYLVGSLEIPLWTVNDSVVKAIGAAVAHDESIARLVVRNEFGKVVYAMAREDETGLVERSARIVRKLSQEDRNIGDVSVALTARVYSAGNRRLLLFASIIICFILAAVLIVTVASIRAALKRPLTCLNEIADRFAAGQYDMSGNLLPYREFQPFGSALAQMAKKIDGQIAEIREAEGKYRSIFENALEGIFQTTIEGRLVKTNPALTRILGDASASELSLRADDNAETIYVQREQREQLLSLLHEHGGVNGYEVRLRRKDGEEIWASISARLVRDEAGQPFLIEGFLADITERKRDESLLRRLNRELRAISSCNQILMRSDDEQSLLYDICHVICSEAGYCMAWVGYPENDESRRIRPLAWAGVESGYLEAARIEWGEGELGQNPSGIAVRSGDFACIQDFKADAGDEPWRLAALERGYAACIALPLKDESNKTFGVLNIYADTANAFTLDETRLLAELAADLAFGIVVLRSRIERARAEQTAALMSFALNNVRESAFLIGEDAGFTFVNDQSCRALGYTRDELLDMGVADLDPDFPIERWASHWKDLRERYSLTFEGRHRARDGHLIPVEINANYFEYDGRGYNLALVRDITERKQTEQKLRRYKEQLEETVQRRTAELMLARDAAEAANRAKSVFLANMSHELRTPLNAILGFSNLIRRDPELSASQRENLEIIKRSGEHLLRLINDVLEIAKIEAGRLQLEVASFDFGGMVRDVAEMMRLRAKENGLQLLLEMTSEVPRYIKGDEARLRQILINLVGNAVKFTEQGGVTIRVGSRRDDRLHLMIEVEDSGPGIGEEDQKRLFKPFVQLAEGGEQKGTGLGLTITKQFVQLMGGAISVESSLGKGSLFRVELPVEPTDTAEIAKPAATHGDIVELAPGQPRYRILIAEDQRENQLLLIRLMTEVGLEVKLAENGEQCVKMFEEWGPDLIWMDRRMPVMDGELAARRIRQLPGGDKVKIVAVTASAFTEEQQEMVDAGMDDFVRKPYRFNEIYDCLSRQLGVRYLYAGVPEVQEAPAELTPAMFAVVPPELRQGLRDAVVTLEVDRITAAINKIGAIAPELGALLSRLSENFDYPAILDVLGEESR